MYTNYLENRKETRTSSCVNAKGILPAAQQVFAVATGGGVLTLVGGTYPGRGVPILAGGYLLWQGYLPWLGWWWGYLPWLGYLSPGVDRQSPVKTIPSPILRMRAVIGTLSTLFFKIKKCCK